MANADSARDQQIDLSRLPFAKAMLAYTPRSLSVEEYALAQIAAVSAVGATTPRSENSAVADLSRLCGFLALTPDWDHASTPDLRALITERSIAQHDARLAERGLSTSSRYLARGVLRRVARVLRGGPPRTRSTVGMRGTAYILHPDQLADLTRGASSDLKLGHEGLILSAQIGAGLSAQATADLRSTDLDCFSGTIQLQGAMLGVLADMAPFLRAARADLDRSGPIDPAELLPDVLARPLWLLTHLQAGTPMAVVDHASARATGSGLQRHELERLLPHLDRPALDRIGANAAAGWWRTVPSDLLTAVRALKATPTVAGPEVPDPVPSTSRSTAPPRRKISRAAALRAAKQAQLESQVRRDPLYLDNNLTEIPGWQALPVDVRRQITNYRPQRVPRRAWAEVEQLARRLLVLRLVVRHTAQEPTTVRKVNIIGSHLAPYLIWARHHLEHQDLPELALLILEETTLDRYTAEAMLDSPRSTVATRRSEVRGALRAARTGPQPQRLPYRPVRPPYLAAEAAYHLRLAKNQPTASRRCGAAFILAAGYGAGLDGRDMATTRACDCFTVDLPAGEKAVLIRVGGDRPRTVVVRQEYQDLLLYAVDLHAQQGRPRNGLMLGRKPGRRNVTTPALERLVTADGRDVVIEVPRLRSTWLVAHMSSAVPLGVLLTAAGLRSVRALADLLSYTSAPEEAECVALLRGNAGMLLGTYGEDDAA